MKRSSDENSTRGDHRAIGGSVEDYESSRANISDADRAQIWAVLSGSSSATSSPKSPQKPTLANRDRRDQYSHQHYNERTAETSSTNTAAAAAQRSKMSKLGKVVKRIFMNDQTVPRRHRRRDSWDEIYRSKDNDKIRPIHEEYGVL